ncbi:hypothetical protein [Teredinibacter purpureus]|uniref:hypothetical protein n=1 Tax=Teredinibacter purpureus TaxID=2731756 RepID=UPI0005F886A8|nr:hypothetical protein [Teredinibacter purpureus]
MGIKKTPQFQIDAYTQHVMSGIDPAVFKSLNIVQLNAIKAAINASAPFRKHPIDIRGTLPLYFTKFYFVFLIGKDRRSHTRNKESLRIEAVQGLSLAMMLYTIFAASLPIIFIILYALKTMLGIDIFADKHLSDFW